MPLKIVNLKLYCWFCFDYIKQQRYSVRRGVLFVQFHFALFQVCPIYLNNNIVSVIGLYILWFCFFFQYHLCSINNNVLIWQRVAIDIYAVNTDFYRKMKYINLSYIILYLKIRAQNRIKLPCSASIPNQVIAGKLPCV